MNQLWKKLRLVGSLLLTLAAASGPALTTACGSKSGTGPSCCKVCSTGKACGDTCIATSSTCHVGTGCACNR
jgi:hypothetical protein